MVWPMEFSLIMMHIGTLYKEFSDVMFIYWLIGRACCIYPPEDYLNLGGGSLVLCDASMLSPTRDIISGSHSLADVSPHEPEPQIFPLRSKTLKDSSFQKKKKERKRKLS